MPLNKGHKRQRVELDEEDNAEEFSVRPVNDGERTHGLKNWGRDVRAYYTAAEDSDSEFDSEDGDKDALEEAESIRTSRWKNIEPMLDSFASGFYDETTSESLPEQKLNIVNAEVLALERLLGKLSSSSSSSSSAESKKHSCISESQLLEPLKSDLSDALSELNEIVKNEVQRYLRIYGLCEQSNLSSTELKRLFLPSISNGMKLLFYFQLRLYIWLVILVTSIMTVNMKRQSMERQLVSQIQLALKVWKKIRKLRTKQFNINDLNIQQDLKLAETKLVQFLNKVKVHHSDDTDEEPVQIDSSDIIVNNKPPPPAAVSNVSVLNLAVDQLRHEKSQFIEQQHLVESFVTEILTTGGLLNKSELERKLNQTKKSVRFQSDSASRTVRSAAAENNRAMQSAAAAEDMSSRLLADAAEIVRAEEDRVENERRLVRSIPSLPLDIPLSSNGDRYASKEIERNRGLVRQRKKTSGNARVSNRRKYEKKLQRLSGGKVLKAVDPIRGSGTYGGESSGISIHVNRSRKLLS